MSFRDLARFAALFLDFGLLSTSRSTECEFGNPLFLKEIWPTAEHDPRGPPAAICSPSSKTSTQRRSYRARIGQAGWSLPTAHAQCPPRKADLFAPDYRRYDASIASRRTRSDRTERMDTPTEAELTGTISLDKLKRYLQDFLNRLLAARAAHYSRVETATATEPGPKGTPRGSGAFRRFSGILQVPLRLVQSL